ncbi:hypothetical protein CSE16_10400 [Solibacillus sp. R5-41]|uniref:5' nucleotidase, NT5C type n=1 Tax=Solibacillus sp. R5-41 TaxID=2048654 RepID=UPI000C1296E5|nr:hypothetical protein [Solibacillus sp. R5-41]ATP40425.1 hypothetical protein CSE16_10400 [Solibacillus sp. R5-41]
MKFGFDIDDTLIHLRGYAFELYNKEFEQNFGVDVFQGIPTVEIHAPFGLTNEEGRAMWKRSMETIYFTSCPVYEGALETLQALVAEGHDVYYITSRPKQFCGRTKDWMIAQGFPVAEGHFFCGMEDDEKIATIKALELDYYVDDKPAVLDTLSAVSTKVIVKDQSYNQHVTYPRLTDWKDFEKLR